MSPSGNKRRKKNVSAKKRYVSYRKRAQRAKSILEDIRLFERAELMRKYCDIAEQRTNSEDYKQTLDIARSVADWIDPTKDYIDETLASRYEVSDFM